MKAFLKNYRQSPRKVRLVADLIRNKDIKTARSLLHATPRRAALPLRKLLDSAVSNAVQGKKFTEEDLFVKYIQVNEGPTLKRIMPRARGSAYTIRKRTSRVLIELAERMSADKKPSSEKAKRGAGRGITKNQAVKKSVKEK